MTVLFLLFSFLAFLGILSFLIIKHYSKLLDQPKSPSSENYQEPTAPYRPVALYLVKDKAKKSVSLNDGHEDLIVETISSGFYWVISTCLEEEYFANRLPSHVFATKVTQERVLSRAVNLQPSEIRSLGELLAMSNNEGDLQAISLIEQIMRAEDCKN